MKHFQSILDFATEKHRGQKRNGRDYITHPISVAEIAVKMARDSHTFTLSEIELIYIISLFHDLVEDSGVTEKEMRYILKKNSNLFSHEIDKIVLAVIRLSRMSKEENVISYLAGIKADKYARIVKLADLEHNLSDLGPGNLRDKYHLCKYFLTN